MHASLYDILKILHILSGIVVFTTIFTLPSLFNIKKEISKQQRQSILKISWFISLPAMAFQPLSGFSIIGLQHYSIRQEWIWSTFIGFVILICSWLIGIYFLSQNKIKHWRLSIFVSFIALLIMLFFMANRIA